MQPRVTLYVGVAAPLVDEHGVAVPPIDHRRYLRELKETLEGQPVSLVARVGLTRQAFRGDLLRLRPELVALFCHGTEDGHLLLEDGRGRAVLVPGEELLPALKPRPVATFVAACHSQAAVERAGVDWDGAALIAIDPETPVEVAACAQFQSYFYSALLAGRAVGEAFEDAVEFVAGSDTVGDRAFVAEAVPASRKFRLLAGHGVQLSEVATGELLAVAHDPMPVPHVRSAEMRRGADRFVGRQREVAEVIDALLPLAAGRRAPGRGDRRCVTLTKEGGIGKTALAVEVAEWVRERECFAGVLEVSCEEMRLPGQLPARLLKLLGLPEAEQKGDLVELLCEVVRERVGDSSVLLVLDNLDDLVATTSPQELRGETRAVIEKLLGVAPRLRVLATCRWPIGLAADERVVAVLPLSEDNARDVFLSHLDKPEHVREACGTWDQEGSPARRLIRLSGRHPQSLRLLARQLRRPALSLERLCAEAHENLLGKLVDPYAADDEEDRRYKVERSYELSYRHLSDAARQLFARLARFPSGIWCGSFPEGAIGWHEVLGDDWKYLIERELDFFALVHFEDDRSGTGFYRMLPSMLELARKKLVERQEGGWRDVWIGFWRLRLKAWNELLEGKISDDLAGLILLCQVERNC